MSRPTVKSDTPPSFILRDFMPFQVTLLSKKLSRLIASEYEDQYGVTTPEWRVLAMIGQYEEVTARQVTDQTPMDKVAVSRAVASLVEKGLILKRASEEDRRATLLRLSRKGERVTREIQEIAVRYETDTMAALSEKEQQSFQKMVNKLIAQTERIRS